MRGAICRLCVATLAATIAASATATFTRTIMITGYWPPTNEMIRPFSQNIAQNPGGWTGENWENRGYNIVSYFPEFPGGTVANPRGNGDFEVDYQDASADFWRITSEVKPLAIISFSRGNAGISWEIESRARKLPNESWVQDYLAPFRPTADMPIGAEPDGTIRYSSLPMVQIRDAVSAAIPPLRPFIDTSNQFGGNFVSEFTSYHSAWYADLHRDSSDPAQVFAGGHIHVGIDTPTNIAVLATKISLRQLTGYLDTVIPAPSSMIALCGLFVLRRRR